MVPHETKYVSDLSRLWRGIITPCHIKQTRKRLNQEWENRLIIASYDLAHTLASYIVVNYYSEV